MKFGRVPLANAQGALLAHSQRLPDRVIRKGTRLTEEDVAALQAAGMDDVIAAQLGPGDLHEDAAARRIAEAAAGEGVRVDRADTGRANLFARDDGLIVVDAAAVDRLNAIDPALTLATLDRFERVRAGRMLATVKIIPFGAAQEHVEIAERVGACAVSLAPWRVRRVSTISTTLPALKESVIDKTVRVLGGRLEATAADIVEDRRVPHDADALAEVLSASTGETLVVFGASAVVDPADVIPAAIEAAGGRVEHVGMPVDPGNLLVLGTLGERVVIGAPGCARSPKPNGFDIVLDRVLAGLPVTRADIVGMGVGGLLEEIELRPRPRQGPRKGPQAPAAVVLAAGQSTRMGAQNKLIAPLDGVPLVRRVVEAALASRARPVVVVTGHQSEAVHDALAGCDVRFVHNDAYKDGLSTSLKAGIAAVAETADAALILLGDMPLVRAVDCDALIAALAPEGVVGAAASAEGKRGNPVAWSAEVFGELMQADGDSGGRALMQKYGARVAKVEIGEAALRDADTPGALDALRRDVEGALTQS